MLILSRPARDINRKDEIDVDVGLIILKYCVSFEFCVVDSIPSLSRGHYFHMRYFSMGQVQTHNLRSMLCLVLEATDSM